jgi:hypothetical protein
MKKFRIMKIINCHFNNLILNKVNYLEHFII